MKFKLFRAPEGLDKHVLKHELVAVENGSDIHAVADLLVKAVSHDLSDLPQFEGYDTTAYPPEPIQLSRRVKRYKYEMTGVVMPKYGKENLLMDYGIIEEAE